MATKQPSKKDKTEKAAAPITITLAEKKLVTIWLLGITPLILNKQSEKTKRTLLFPNYFEKGRADKKLSLKHDPLKEYRDSIYRDERPNAPTLIQIKGGAVKAATCDSAVDVPNMQAAPVRRAVSVPEWYVNVYGVPCLFMTDVRQSGPAKTPDIRTRAAIKDWAIEVTFQFCYPMVNEKQLLNLCANGGVLRGVGDGRPEKGALNFGQYEVVNGSDPRVKAIVKKGGYAAQVAAMNTPNYFDVESRELYEWFVTALEEYGNKSQSISSNGDGHSEDAEEEAALV
jgi:hypothetical protein